MASQTLITTRNGEVVMRVDNLNGQWMELSMRPAEANGLADLLNTAAKRARKAGASEEELAEATMVAAAMRAGGGVAHATHVIRD